MKVSDFDEFDHFETEGLLTGSKERNWLWLGLIVSLGFISRFAPIFIARVSLCRRRIRPKRADAHVQGEARS